VKLDQYDEAINLLARFAERNLPDGYTLILTFSKSESSMQLEGPDDDIEGDDPPRGFVDACELACEDYEEHLNQEGQT
jgi:hypothetical protein